MYLLGFNTDGNDDYMVKPSEFAGLLLRVRALLRRTNILMERKFSGCTGFQIKMIRGMGYKAVLLWVVHGDFSVFVPTVNTIEKLDYLDVMIMDFNRMVEELGSIETLKTDFFTNVSHEIKTPISVISNYAQLLHRDGLTEEQKADYIDNILHASRRISNLLRINLWLCIWSEKEKLRKYEYGNAVWEDSFGNCDWTGWNYSSVNADSVGKGFEVIYS